MMDELSMVVRRAIAHTATQYEMSIVQFSHWLARRNPSMRKDFIGLEGMNQRDLSRTIENVLTLFTGEESQMEFDAAKYTELANSGMSNARIIKEMAWPHSDTKFRNAAIKAGVYQKDPSGSQMKKADAPKLAPSISAAEMELVKQLANANVGRVDDGGFKPMTVTIAKDAADDNAKSEPWARLHDGINGELERMTDELRKTKELLVNKEESIKRHAMPVVDPEEQFITIRIPLHKPSYAYKGKGARDESVQEAMRLMSDVAESVNDDITDLLGEEDIERVQAYVDRIIGKATAQ